MRRINSAAFGVLPSIGPTGLYATVHGGGADVYLPNSLGEQLGSANSALVVMGVHEDLSWLGTGIDLNGIIKSAVTVDVSSAVLRQSSSARRLASHTLTEPVIVQLPTIKQYLVKSGWYLYCLRWNPVAREFSSSGVSLQSTTEVLDSSGDRGYQVRCKVNDINPMILVVAQHPIDRSADLRTCSYYEDDFRDRCNTDNFEFTGEGSLYSSKVFILLLIVILILIAVTIAGIVDDCTLTRWSEKDFITDDAKFQPSAAKGCCSGYDARLVFVRHTHDHILRGLEPNEINCCHAIDTVLATNLKMPLADVNFLLYVWRRSNLDSSSFDSETAVKPFNGTHKIEAMFPDMFSFRECLSKISDTDPAALLLPQFFAEHPLVMLRRFSILRRSYMKHMYYSMFILGTFGVAALYFSLFGQAVLQGAADECQQDVNILETLCLVIGSMVIAGCFSHVLFSFHFHDIVYICPYTEHREQEIVNSWHTCSVVLACLAFGFSTLFVLYTNNFIIKASDNDRDRLFVVCVCVVTVEWLLRPAAFAVFIIMKYGSALGKQSQELRDKCATRLGIIGPAADQQVEPEATGFVEKASREIPPPAEPEPPTEGSIDEAGPAAAPAPEPAADAVDRQFSGYHTWWEWYNPKPMSSESLHPSAAAAILPAAAAAAAIASSNGRQADARPTEEAIVVDAETFTRMQKMENGNQAVLGDGAAAGATAHPVSETARAVVDIDGQQVQVIGVDSNNDGIPDVLKDEEVVTVGVDTKQSGRIDTYVMGRRSSLERAGVLEAPPPQPESEASEVSPPTASERQAPQEPPVLAKLPPPVVSSVYNPILNPAWGEAFPLAIVEEPEQLGFLLPTSSLQPALTEV